MTFTVFREQLFAIIGLHTVHSDLNCECRGIAVNVEKKIQLPLTGRRPRAFRRTKDEACSTLLGTPKVPEG